MFCSGKKLRVFVFPFSLILYWTGCSRKEASTGVPARYAVVRFENQSGDPSLDWAGRAVSDYLSRTLAKALDGPVLTGDALARSAAGLGPEPSGAPGSSAQRADAAAAGATRLVSGELERNGKQIRISATEEDLTTHKTVRIVTASDGDALKAMADLARKFSATASPYVTSNENALRLYATGLEQPPAEAVKTIHQAVEQDPNFGPGWVTLVNLTNALGGKAEAMDLAATGATHSLDPLSRAELDLERASLENDADKKIAALRQVADLSPADSNLLRSLANLESAKGRFLDAAATWKKLETVLPGDVDALNQGGYNRAWGGDLPGALALLKEYARLRPQDPNALDSAGDVQYLYRKFADAANSYLEAQARNPQFQSGGELYKAAWAQFEAGDQAKAEKTFGAFDAARDKGSADLRTLLKGDWLYRTGRKAEAIALLRGAAASQAVSSQLAVWDLMAGNRAAAQKDMAAITQITSTATLMAKFASLPSASPEEWKKRAEASIHGTGSENIRDLALGYALILDGKKDAAKPVWEKIVRNAPATDFFAQAVLAALEGKQPRFPILPDPNNPNQMRALVQ